MTMRVMPPADGLHPSITTPGGRTWTCALGSTIDVPDQDGVFMTINGWIAAAPAAASTAARPSNPLRGQTFHDTTLGINIVFDGKVWRNPTSGASV